MTGLKLLGAAAILSSALAVSAAAQEAVQEPGSLGQAHPFADYLTGGYGVHGTSRGQYGSYDGDYGMMIGPRRLCLLRCSLRARHLVCWRGRVAALLQVIPGSHQKAVRPDRLLRIGTGASPHRLPRLDSIT